MKLFISFFNCGTVKIRPSNLKRCDYYVQSLNLVVEKIISHFEKYSLNNFKGLNFSYFKTVINMIHN